MSKEKSASAGHTPTPWMAANMIHGERGDAMTPEELGAYVTASVRKSIENGGSAERFLIITTEGEKAPDICHVGNGPRGPANAAYIVRAVNAHAELVEATIEQSLMIERAQEIITQYLVPDGYDADEAMALLIEHFDGPNQRRVKAVARDALSRAES